MSVFAAQELFHILDKPLQGKADTRVSVDLGDGGEIFSHLHGVKPQLSREKGRRHMAAAIGAQLFEVFKIERHSLQRLS